MTNDVQRRGPVALPGDEPFDFAHAKELALDRFFDDEDDLPARPLFADGQIIPEFCGRINHDNMSSVRYSVREGAGTLRQPSLHRCVKHQAFR